MTPSSRPRKSALVRDPRSKYPVGEIEYGLEILTLLASVRFATIGHIQRILFDRDSPTERQARHRATRSLRRLFDSGYLTRVPVFAPSASSGVLSRQVVQVLSPLGARLVGVEPRWVRTRAPKPYEVLTHDFWLVEVAVRAMEGCPEPLSIQVWWDDRVLAGRRRQGALSLPTIPDGFLLVENLSTGKLYPSLVELDLGTETVNSPTRIRRDVARKITGYLDYLGTEFRQDFGLDAPPIVLVITDSERRLASLRDMTRRLGGGGRFWFATLDRLDRQSTANAPQTITSAGLQGPFWVQNWQTGLNDECRSLAARCGA